jgi:hypothetical protein
MKDDTGDIKRKPIKSKDQRFGWLRLRMLHYIEFNTTTVTNL